MIHLSPQARNLPPIRKKQPLIFTICHSYTICNGCCPKHSTNHHSRNTSDLPHQYGYSEIPFISSEQYNHTAAVLFCRKNGGHRRLNNCKNVTSIVYCFTIVSCVCQEPDCCKATKQTTINDLQLHSNDCCKEYTFHSQETTRAETQQKHPTS